MVRINIKSQRDEEGETSVPVRRPVMDIAPRTSPDITRPPARAEWDPASSPFFQAPKTERRHIDDGDGEDMPPKHVRHFSARRRRGLIAGFAGVLALAAVALFFLLPKASVDVTFRRTVVPFSVTLSVATSTAEAKLSGSSLALPGELFSVSRNADIPVSATTTAHIEEKASGKLIIYNAFGTASQALVATTRFQSPEGKIFRIPERVTVPGATKNGTELIPGSVEVRVVADEVGESYNVPASKNWKIPGFSGTTKYDGFYAEAPAAMTGGFIGERAVAAGADAERGTSELSEALKASAESELALLMKSSFKLFPETKMFTLGPVDVRPDPEDAGLFRLFGEGTLKVLAFDEHQMIETIAEVLMPSGGVDLRVASSSISYGAPTVDFAKGALSVSATGTIAFEESFDMDAFKKSISGLTEDQVRTAVSALPGVVRGAVSLSPFWVGSVPSSPNRIEITVNAEE